MVDLLVIAGIVVAKQSQTVNIVRHEIASPFS